MRATFRVKFPAILGCVLIFGTLAAHAADEAKGKANPPELTAEQKAKLKERDGLVREAEQLRDKGKYAEALERAAGGVEFDAPGA